jgi:glucose-1-phosphate cytidylyltransferase
VKAVVLAGGLGTRLSEETTVRPKPMVEIGGRPILWHIMKLYAAHGVTDFVICAGYKGHLIKEYFATYFLRNSTVTFDLEANRMELHGATAEPWRVTVVDTGESSMTGGRLRRVRDFVGDSTFCLTYGDGVSDVDITALIAFHRAHGRLATLGADDSEVAHFKEKPTGDGGWINGGFFVLEPRVIDYIAQDDTVWEDGPLRALAESGQLRAYRHSGFWQPMDTLRDRELLERLWSTGAAPWKIWQ